MMSIAEAPKLTWLMSARENAERAVSILRHAERERCAPDYDIQFIATLVSNADAELRCALNRCEDTAHALKTQSNGGSGV